MSPETFLTAQYKFLYPNLNSENEKHFVSPISRNSEGYIRYNHKNKAYQLEKIHDAEEELNCDPLIFKFIENKFNSDPASFKKSIDLILKGVNQKFLNHLFSAKCNYSAQLIKY